MAAVRIVPLGGLGEIGMNCLILEQDGRRVLIDCGVSFPFGDYGIDTYHPRFDVLREDPDALDGVVITHGHEDHIGALGHLVSELDRREPIRVWGASYALGLCRLRLEERGLDARVVMSTASPGQHFAVGPFTFEPVRVTHSTPEATALAIDTAAGCVVHSGDFKLDPKPRDGQLTDEARLRAIGDAGVALLMSDSTNSLADGTTASEATVAEALDRVIAASQRRVVVGMFASNLHRMDAAAESAERAGRRVCLLGRSMRTHAEVGTGLGMLRWPSDLTVAPEVARTLPRERVLYLATGTQAEGRGSLRRLAAGTHPDLELEPGDEVVLSSRVIPGNERAVSMMIDDFLGAGIIVRSGNTEPALHASGHGHRVEQRRMIDLLRPRAFIPLHGTRQHMVRHADLAREAGVADVMVLHNGEVAVLEEGGLASAPPVTSGRVATAHGVLLSDDVLRERRQLGRTGMVIVAVRGAADGEPMVMVSVRGVPQRDAVIAAASRAARNAWRARSPARDLREEIRVAVRRAVTELIADKPPVEVSLLDP